MAPKIENSIAIISFENLTGDKNKDFYQKSIPNLLITNLENTGYFYVVTWERLHDLLKQMAAEKGTTKTEIIRRALMTYKYLDDETKDGEKRVSITSKEDKSIKDVILP